MEQTLLMADGKWIDGLHAEMPVADAARIVLSARFEVVRSHLPLAVETPYEDSEYVHQLRVGTRRCRAALEVFRDCLPKRDVKEAKAALRTIRRAAGDARDWDVFIQSLEAARALQSAGGKPTLDFLLGYALGERSAAQNRLSEAAGKVGAEFIELSTAIPEHVHDPRGADAAESFGVQAQTDLGRMFNDFNAAVADDPTEPAELHKLRIAGKHLRYAIEVYAPCFAPALKEQLYPEVEGLQEQLGDLQDAVVGIERLAGLRDMAKQTIAKEWPRLRPGITKLLQGMRTKQRSGRRKFQVWKKTWEKLAAGHPLQIATGENQEGESNSP
jgi:CHAD domain-containing protein